ncbi:GL25667 [Drosophila persimilis]|uniref:GL25667 n=1 Tax=Drosophila persimilis TaxID=7234 RepID=B4GKL1_DROPE|nr:GL25667 [Drosophila persimilis]
MSDSTEEQEEKPGHGSCHDLTMVMAEHETETIIDRYPSGLLRMDAVNSGPFLLFWNSTPETASSRGR